MSGKKLNIEGLKNVRAHDPSKPYYIVHHFNHPEFGRLRIFEDPETGELTFSLEDAARALGMSQEEAVETIRQGEKMRGLN